VTVVVAEAHISCQQIDINDNVDYLQLMISVYVARMAHRVGHSIMLNRQLHKLDLPFAANMPPSSNEWDFHLLEKDDIPAASEMILMHMNVNQTTLVEMNWLVGPLIRYGFRSRSGTRLSYPSMILTTDSLILGATVRGTSDMVGFVELCLDQPQGRLSPTIKSIFRSNTVSDYEQPYLCNLFVSKYHRRKGLAKLLCELSEELVQIHWNRNVMYLHVEKSNVTAQALYEGMGYTIVTPELSEFEKIRHGVDDVFYYSNPLKLLWAVKKPDVIDENLN
jgi:ribosomal protein S18 acetylase RimI-like enzyme